jgi:hypothetical protein
MTMVRLLPLQTAANYLFGHKLSGKICATEDENVNMVWEIVSL